VDALVSVAFCYSMLAITAAFRDGFQGITLE
jgi:hypothetical protein